MTKEINTLSSYMLMSRVKIYFGYSENDIQKRYTCSNSHKTVISNSASLLFFQWVSSATHCNFLRPPMFSRLCRHIRTSHKYGQQYHLLLLSFVFSGNCRIILNVSWIIASLVIWKLACCSILWPSFVFFDINMTAEIG